MFGEHLHYPLSQVVEESHPVFAVVCGVYQHLYERFQEVQDLNTCRGLALILLHPLLDVKVILLLGLQQNVLNLLGDVVQYLLIEDLDLR